MFKAGFQFKAKYGWNVEKKQDHSFDVEQPVEKQFTFNGKLVHDWEVSLQRKRLAKMNKEKRLFQTNELDLGGMNKSKAKKKSNRQTASAESRIRPSAFIRPFRRM